MDDIKSNKVTCQSTVHGSFINHVTHFTIFTIASMQHKK